MLQFQSQSTQARPLGDRIVKRYYWFSAIAVALLLFGCTQPPTSLSGSKNEASLAPTALPSLSGTPLPSLGAAGSAPFDESVLQDLESASSDLNELDSLSGDLSAGDVSYEDVS